MNTQLTEYSTQLDKAVLMPLTHLCCYEISGADAQSFLQGQLTNDVNAVVANKGQLSSYCTPKGRMLAIFHICQVKDKYLLLMRKDVAEVVMQRIRMFVLRAKVEIIESTTFNSIMGLAGPAVESVLSTINLATPESDYDVTFTDDAVCMKIFGATPRYLIIGDENLNNSMENLANGIADTHTSAYWQWLDIMSGVPSVHASTQESFVPQMTNMELIDGVNFSKGCYPGQEIVARLHYLGNASRRMFRIESSTDANISPGDDIYQTDAKSKQSIGTIVSAIKENSNKTVALAVLRIEAAQQNQLAIGSPDGIPAVIMSLPYEVPTEKNNSE